MTTLIRRTASGAWPREILVLRRTSGYLRLHVPPLLYVPTLATKLQKGLLALRGVRRVTIDRHRARLSVFYDPWLTEDRAALLEIDRQATGLLDRSEPGEFQAAWLEQDEARRERIQRKLANGAYTGAIVFVHGYVLRGWIRDPVRHWWAWGLVGWGLWTHRRQIKQIPDLSP
jgi:hypothetical protein